MSCSATRSRPSRGAGSVETRARLQAVPDEDYQLGDYVTQSAAMKRVLEAARRVASLDTTLLILGETGVGQGAARARRSTTRARASRALRRRSTAAR